jgi:NAD(P)-dependent dehydrogenase (short-subunit alcohol dehydrogenase family)
MSLSFRLDGKVALVTGASRGLGAGIADALKEAGATVVGTSREHDSADQVAKRLGSVPVAMDVSDVASVREGVDRVASELGSLDILVNNAGLNIPQGVFEVDEASWDAVLDTNLKGTFFCAQAAARHMADGGEGGRIINVASQAGVVGIEERSAYGTSKAGGILLTKVLAIELAHPSRPRRRGRGCRGGYRVSREPRGSYGDRTYAPRGWGMDSLVRRIDKDREGQGTVKQLAGNKWLKEENRWRT